MAIMKENGEGTSFQIPCMYDHKMPCVDCKLYTTNLDNIRKLANAQYFKIYFSKIIGEFPTPQHVSAILFQYEDKVPAFHTETFGLQDIPKPLLAYGREIAEKRREYVVKRFKKFMIEDYAFGVRCPNYKNVEE